MPQNLVTGPNLSVAGTSAAVTQVAPVTFANGDSLNCTFEVPIVEFSTF